VDVDLKVFKPKVLKITMKIIEKKENQITFSAEIEESLINAIRRYLNQIPILAIDESEISRNDSPLFDEVVSHRLGLVPLEMDKVIKEGEEIKLKLSVNKEGYVYSGELKGKVKPVYDKIPITSLNKGQELEITAIAKIGKGSDHAKFSPGLIFYRNIVDIKIDKDCPKEVVEICPQKILTNESGKVTVTDSIKCDMCEACTEVCQKMKKDSIKLIPTKELMVTLESFGQLSVEELFNKSISVLKKDLAEVSKKISK
jgi:DNA-directed RNA polymerase subunit D